MTRVGLGITISVTAAALIAATVYRLSSSPERQTRAPRDANELEQLRTEIKQLRAEQASNTLLTAQLAYSRRGELERNVEQELPVAASAHDPSPAAPAPVREITEAEYVAQLDGKFGSEVQDPKWSQSAAREASRAITAVMPIGTKLGKVECRTSLCKVESFHENLNAFHSFADSALLGRERQLWNGGVATMVRSENGSGVTAITYIAKEGQGVPPPTDVDE